MGHTSVVGVGASAGGLDACSRLLHALPPATDLAFVVLQHLDPTHPSELAALLGRATTMPVRQASDGQAVEPGHVYVIPPTAVLSIEGGRLRLAPRPPPSGPATVIDQFLESLATDQGALAVGVILSGTGSDGARGIAAIQAAGGRTFAQDPATAEHCGMPQAAIDTGCADLVLSPDHIAQALAGLPVEETHQPMGPGSGSAAPASDEAVALDEVTALLQHATGVDFGRYKRATLVRRIGRRQRRHRLDSAVSYLALLQREPDEVRALYQDVLIHVTHFFRDPVSFDAVSSSVFPSLLRDRSSGHPLRIWVAGCATGQEAYSMAISALEAAETLQPGTAVQLFASDLSDPALEVARRGVYPATISREMTAERLERFFTVVKGGYQVRASLRDCCVFTRHDVTHDPPFSRIDLVSCRNLLIYLASPLQERVLRAFHYALVPGGILVLGEAETVGGLEALFAPSDRKHKIYRRQPAETQVHTDFPRHPSGAGHNSTMEARPIMPPTAQVTDDLQQVVEQGIVAAFGLASALVTEKLEVLHIRGPAAPYLNVPDGAPTAHLLRLVHADLKLEVGRALRTAHRTGRVVRRFGCALRQENRTLIADLHVIPVAGTGGADPLYLVAFASVDEPRQRRDGRALRLDTPSSLPGDAGSPGPGSGPGSRIEELERELGELRGYVDTVVAEKETTNAELQAAYEESLSSNQEYQSTNEELETTKEELQSLNEELKTVNDELEQRNGALAELNGDLTNLLESVEIPIVLLSADLRIREYSPEAERLLRLKPADKGRPIGKCRLSALPNDLAALAQQVMDQNVVQARKLLDDDGQWRELRLRPYRAADGTVTGVVLALVDIDQLKRSLDLVSRARDYSEAIVETAPEPLLILDDELRVKTANNAFYRAFKLAPATVLGQPIAELGGGDWDIPALNDLLSDLLSVVRHDGRHVDGCEVTHEFRELGRRTLRISGRRIVEPAQRSRNVLLALSDVTEQQVGEARLRQAAKIQAVGQLAGGVAHDINNAMTVVLGFAEFLLAGLPPDDPRRADVLQIVHSAESAANTTRQLLAFSRQQLSQPVVVDVDPFVRGLEPLFQRLLGAHAEVRMSLGAPGCGIRADRAELEQTLVSLALNARDAMPTGGTFTVETTRRVLEQDGATEFPGLVVPNGVYVRLSISDTGVGIPPEVLPRVFEPFFTTKPVGRGTGLGLASAYGIVKGSGGFIWAESEVGRGTTFMIDLPEVAPVPSDGPAAAAAMPAALAPNEEAVLLVEDEAMVRAWVARVLRELGYTVLEAGDGAEALGLLEARGTSVALILSDVVMPVMSGPALAARLAELYPGTPILFMSGYAQEDIVGQGLPEAGHPLLCKPFTPAALAAAVASLLHVKTPRA
jgi:two-component system CheB/CheR fusion protein